MTPKERREWERLSRRWAGGRATMAQMLRCMALDRKAATDEEPMLAEIKAHYQRKPPRASNRSRL